MACGTRDGPVRPNATVSFSRGRWQDVFVHISAVERAGLSRLNEGQQIEYEIEEDRGKTSAVNLKGQVSHLRVSGDRCGGATGRSRWSPRTRRNL